MDKKSQQVFDKIIIKEIYELVPVDILFLKARRSYLNATQLKKYSSILEEKQKELSYKELMAKAKSMGHKVRVGLTRAQLEEMVG